MDTINVDETVGRVRSFLYLANLAERIVASELSWLAKFDLIFSEHFSDTVEELNIALDYHRSGTSYEADVRAYVEAIREKASELSKLDLGSLDCNDVLPIQNPKLGCSKAELRFYVKQAIRIRDLAEYDWSEKARRIFSDEFPCPMPKMQDYLKGAVRTDDCKADIEAFISLLEGLLFLTDD